jgi:acetyltransferase-like isoleucine patch superfamily enzyme
MATRRLTGKALPLNVRVNPGLRFVVRRSPNAAVVVDGIVHVHAWGMNRSPSSISLSGQSSLRISGNFGIGPGVHLSVGKGGVLEIGGQRQSLGSGITCNTRIMVEKLVRIGVDCLIAWDVFISDSNWHDIEGVERCKPIYIGDNVWISHGVSVVKGANIPSGCIVGAKSLVGKGDFPEASLLAGVPATVKRTGVQWSR